VAPERGQAHVGQWRYLRGRLSHSAPFNLKDGGLLPGTDGKDWTSEGPEVNTRDFALFLIVLAAVVLIVAWLVATASIPL
jgi:hypothetical protein